MTAISSSGVYWPSVGFDVRRRAAGVLLGVGTEAQSLVLKHTLSLHALGGLSLDHGPWRTDLYGLFGPRYYIAWGAGGGDILFDGGGDDPGVDEAVLFAGIRAEIRYLLPERREYVGLLLGWDDDLTRSHHEYDYFQSSCLGVCSWGTVSTQHELGMSQWVVGVSFGKDLSGL